MSNVENILNQARAWFDCKESDGSHKEIIDTYNGHKLLARGYKVKYTDNWCATFVSACAIKTNLTNIIPLECSCGEMIELAKQMNIWNENDDITPKAGDIIMYDWDNQDGWPEHVGIVESVTNNQITVIEGNKSNAVGRRVINVGNASIRGYIQPNYDGSVTNNQPSKPISNEKAVNYKVKVNTKSGVNCRKEPSISSAKITAYANGTQLTITKEKNGWGYANNTGWVSLEYCNKVNDNISDTWIDRLNIECGKQGFSNYPTVKKGASGNITKLIQERLNSVGFNLNVDGIFGADTETAVKVFQRNRGLTQDGIVGKNTWNWLLKGTKM